MKRYIPPLDLEWNGKLYFSINTCDYMDLPKYDDTKRMNCSGYTTIKDVIDFAHGRINFAKHVIHSRNGGFNAVDHIDMTLPVTLEDGKEEYISLPQDMKLGII